MIDKLFIYVYSVTCEQPVPPASWNVYYSDKAYITEVTCPDDPSKHSMRLVCNELSQWTWNNTRFNEEFNWQKCPSGTEI